MALLHWDTYKKKVNKSDAFFLRILDDNVTDERKSIIAEKRLSVKQKGARTFCTGSKYEGIWDTIGMRGCGYYLLFYGVEYYGENRDGMFNERGTLIYPNNAKMDGYWENGQLVAHRYFYSDNLCFGPYCEMPDRRFYLEIQDKIYPAGRSFLTNSIVTREIPEGCYDTGDGFYNPAKHCVYDPIETNRIIRIPTEEEHQWIINHCRKAWDEPVGFKPELYENWHSKRNFTDTQPSKKRIMRKSLDLLCYRN